MNTDQELFVGIVLILLGYVLSLYVYRKKGKADVHWGKWGEGVFFVLMSIQVLVGTSLVWNSLGEATL